jgi:hypothetical protein
MTNITDTHITLSEEIEFNEKEFLDYKEAYPEQFPESMSPAEQHVKYCSMLLTKLEKTSAKKQTHEPAKLPDEEIDFDALRLPPSGQLLAKRDLSIVPVRRPKKTEWFRVRPGDEWRIDLPLYAAEGEEPYLIAPEYQGFLNEQGLVQRARIYTLIVHGTGIMFLSPITLPDADGKQNSYNRSRIECYLKAETKWVKIAANKALGGYDCSSPESALSEPEWPTPPHTLKEMLSIAFKGRYINDADHPIIKHLKGRL